LVDHSKNFVQMIFPDSTQNYCSIVDTGYSHALYSMYAKSEQGKFLIV